MPLTSLTTPSPSPRASQLYPFSRSPSPRSTMALGVLRSAMVCLSEVNDLDQTTLSDGKPINGEIIKVWGRWLGSKLASRLGSR
jgi:hypothetical protein